MRLKVESIRHQREFDGDQLMTSEPITVQELLSQSVPLRILRKVAVLEGATLIMLMLVAVPLKHLAEYDMAVSIIGPIHGIAFLVYLYAVFEAWGARELSGWAVLRCFLAALVPFGTWVNDRTLARQAKAVDTAPNSPAQEAS